MLPHDPLVDSQIFAEAWAFDAVKRRPWRAGNDAVLCEYLLAKAICDDLDTEEEDRQRWTHLAAEIFDLAWRGLACFFALVGLFVVARQPPEQAIFLAGLLTLGGVLFELWRGLSDRRWAGELEELAVMKGAERC